MMEQRKLRDLQLVELQILKDFAALCEANNLSFYITAGTLLGAVRHKGFIPWDDDIDVVMPRADFDRLMMLTAPHGYFLQNRKSDPNYPFFFAKLRKEGTVVEEPTLTEISMHKGIYIDIFPLDICPNSRMGGMLYFKWVGLLQCAVMARVNPGFVCGYTKKYAHVFVHMFRMLPLNWLDGLWNLTRSILRKLCRSYRLSTACAAHGYPREAYETEWFSTVVELEFEGSVFPAPCGWEALLRNMYGNYMAPPPEEDRRGHFSE